MTLKTIEGTFIAPKGKYALVVGRFNSFVVESLVSGAIDALVRHGVSESDITIIRAPGAFEIPQRRCRPWKWSACWRSWRPSEQFR